MKHIIFPALIDGKMANACEQNINGMDMGYSFEVDEFEPAELNAGEFGYQYRETKDDLDIVFPDGRVEKAKGKVLRLSKSDMQPIVDAEKFARKQKQMLSAAKALIGVVLVKEIGSINTQLNASTATDPDVIEQWQAKFALRDEIKFTHGKRLKQAIRNASDLNQLEKISTTMNKDYERWANA